jgi:hypothetical protein
MAALRVQCTVDHQESEYEHVEVRIRGSGPLLAVQ